MANEVAMVMLVHVLREVCGRAICPSEVHFKHDTTFAMLFEDFFGCTVKFGSNKNGLIFNSKDLEVQTLKADRDLVCIIYHLPF
jgi:hypothetical protein